jgi:hypothetical protein
MKYNANEGNCRQSSPQKTLGPKAVTRKQNSAVNLGIKLALKLQKKYS